ncbi:MAG: TIGR03943 family protein [Alkalispirochaeta sp.]
MRDTHLRILTAVLAVGIFGLLVVTTIDGSVRAILNPRILPRTLIGAGAFAAAALIWAVDGIRRPHSGSGLSLAAAWPLLVPVILLPAAAQSTSSDYSQIRLFTAGGSGGSAAEAVYSGAGQSAAVSLGSGTLGGIAPPASGSPHAAQDADSAGISLSGAAMSRASGEREELESGWVDGANPELLAAVAAAERLGPDQPVPPESLTGVGRGSGPESLSPERREAIAELARTAGPITIDTDTFSRRVNLIWDDPGRFAGEEVRLTGFVYRRPDWPIDTFVVARLSIWCCAADAAVVGLLARADRAATAPSDGQWVELSGTLGVRDEFRAGSVAMENMPELTALEWTTIKAPRFEYVFPE